MLQANLPLVEAAAAPLPRCATCNKRFRPEGISVKTKRPYRVCVDCRGRNFEHRTLRRLRPIPTEDLRIVTRSPHRIAFLEGIRLAWQRANGNAEFKAWLNHQIAQPDHVALWEEVEFHLDTARNNALFTRWLDARIAQERATHG